MGLRGEERKHQERYGKEKPVAIGPSLHRRNLIPSFAPSLTSMLPGDKVRQSYEKILRRDAAADGMRFRDVLADFPDKRDEILERLLALAREEGANAQMRQNLFAEERPDEADWKELIEALLKAPASTPVIQGAIREWCRSCNRRKPFMGGPAYVRGDVTYFRFVTFKRLVQILYELGFPSTASAECFLRHHLDLDPSEFQPIWAKTPLGRYLMWSTFGADPDTLFGSPRQKAEAIVCALGLVPEPNEIYLILQFKLPAGTVPFIPSFCTAYAGDPWNRYFRTPFLSDPHGITMPTDTCARQTGYPEVVHEVITGGALTRPLQHA